MEPKFANLKSKTNREIYLLFLLTNIFLFRTDYRPGEILKRSDTIVNDIESEKILLKEQKKLLDVLKERLFQDHDSHTNTKNNLNGNHTQKLIDKIDLKNKELQNIIDNNEIKTKKF